MKIISIDNQVFDIDCIGCSLANKTIVPYGSIIYESKYFIVSQDFEIPIPAFLVMSSKRHISSIADFSPDEFNDFSQLLIKTRKALKQIMPNTKITIIQKEDRPHFHLWFFPKFSWMDFFGNKLSGISEILEYSRKNLKTKTTLKEILDYNLKIKNFIKKTDRL
jgi:diadenosine tetraphosphate (Ap4A) HIT family hydrolase